MKKQYQRMLSYLMVFILVLLTPLSTSMAKGATKIDFVDTSGYESLAEIYKDYFKFGCGCEAVSHWNYGTTNVNKEIGTPEKEAVISNLFNSITCGNELKPAYNFNPGSETLFKIDTSGEEMLKWAKEHNIGLRFHVLVWHAQADARFFAKDFVATSDGVATNDASKTLDEDCLTDRDTLIDRLKKYIYGAMEYLYSNGFAGTVYAMDVVNEAVDEINEDGLRKSYWYRIIGPEFLYYAFLFTREAEVKYAKEYASLYGLDPEGDLSSIMPKLFYNDYNEWYSSRISIMKDFITNRFWNKDQAMVKSDVIKPDGDGSIKGDGLIDGIGMQCHLDDDFNISSYMSAIRSYNEFVDEVHITELDVGCKHLDENRWYYQAKFYYDFFKSLIEEVKNGVNVTSVTIWGLTDDETWRKGLDPLLFSSNLTAKPAYYGVVKAGKGEDFDLTLAETITELKDISIDFEPYKDENGTNTSYSAESAGFIPRASGHMPKLRPITEFNHTPDAVLGFSLLCERSERDATCMMDISKFSGRNITFTAYVKTTDTEVAIGIDAGASSKELKRITCDDEWHAISVNADIPEKLSSAYIYFETNGSANLYIDDISIIYTKDGEEPAKVVEDVTPTPDVTATPEPSANSGESSSSGSPNTETSTGESKSSNSTVIVAIILIVTGSVFICLGLILLLKNRKKEEPEQE